MSLALLPVEADRGAAAHRRILVPRVVDPVAQETVAPCAADGPVDARREPLEGGCSVTPRELDLTNRVLARRPSKNCENFYLQAVRERREWYYLAIAFLTAAGAPAVVSGISVAALAWALRAPLSPQARGRVSMLSRVEGHPPILRWLRTQAASPI